MCSHACLSACMGWGVRFGTGSLWECSSSAVALRRLRESEGPCAADVIMAGEARMASGVLYIRSYMQECDARHAHACASVKWDSGNKPEIDNTYYVYNCGNDGLYHLAQAEEVHPNPSATLPPSTRFFCPLPHPRSSSLVFAMRAHKKTSQWKFKFDTWFDCGRFGPFRRASGSCRLSRSGRYPTRKGRLLISFASNARPTFRRTTGCQVAELNCSQAEN